MRTKDELQTKITAFNTFLQTECKNEPAELLERMTHMEILISQSGEYLADAKYMQDEVTNSSILDAMKKALEKTLSVSTINLFVKTAAKESNYLVNQLDRINRTATHQHEGLRTRISFIKSTYN